MAKRRKKSRKSYRRRARRGGGSKCCPVIRVRCKAGAPGKPKMCTISVGGSRARKMNSAAAGRFIGKLVRAQQKRRCRPLVKGSAT